MVKIGIDVAADVILPDEPTPIRIMLINNTDTDHQIAVNDVVANLVLEKLWDGRVTMHPACNM